MVFTLTIPFLRQPLQLLHLVSVDPCRLLSCLSSVVLIMMMVRFHPLGLLLSVLVRTRKCGRRHTVNLIGGAPLTDEVRKVVLLDVLDASRHGCLGRCGQAALCVGSFG